MLRYKITVLFILLISICTFNFVEAGTNELPLLGKVIYLDPGHGGLDPGAMYKNIKEKNNENKDSFRCYNHFINDYCKIAKFQPTNK